MALPGLPMVEPGIEVDLYTSEQGIVISEAGFQLENTISLELGDNYVRPYIVVGDAVIYGEAYKYIVDVENIWTPRKDFPGYPLRPVIVIGDKVYMSQDWAWGEPASYWAFDPVEETWEQLGDFPGGVRSRAVGFAIDGKGYLGTGTLGGDNNLNDFWKYDPVNGFLGTTAAFTWLSQVFRCWLLYWK